MNINTYFEELHKHKDKMIIINIKVSYDGRITYSWSVSNAIYTGVRYNTKDAALKDAQKVIENQIKENNGKIK